MAIAYQAALRANKMSHYNLRPATLLAELICEIVSQIDLFVLTEIRSRVSRPASRNPSGPARKLHDSSVIRVGTWSNLGT